MEIMSLPCIKIRKNKRKIGWYMPITEYTFWLPKLFYDNKWNNLFI